jgi:hypothetical protein
MNLVTKFHEVLAVILKGVIKSLRTGLATCRFLYIASIGSAPSISLYGLSTIFFSPGRLKDVLIEMNLLVCVSLHWSLLAMYKVFINRMQVTWKNPWCDVTRVDIFNFSPKGHRPLHCNFTLKILYDKSHFCLLHNSCQIG